MTNKRGKPRRQPPIKRNSDGSGGRVYRVTGLDPRLEEWIEAQMQRWNCLGPMVISTALSFVSGIELEPAALMNQRPAHVSGPKVVHWYPKRKRA